MRALDLSYDSSNTILLFNARSCKYLLSFTLLPPCGRRVLAVLCAVRANSAAFGFATGSWVPELDWVQREFVTYDPRPADTLPV